MKRRSFIGGLIASVGAAFTVKSRANEFETPLAPKPEPVHPAWERRLPYSLQDCRTSTASCVVGWYPVHTNYPVGHLHEADWEAVRERFRASR